MQFTIAAAAFLTLLSSAFAQTANFDAITIPAKNQKVIADGTTSTTILWEPTPEYNDKTVSILLLQGASQGTLDFYSGPNIASNINSSLGSYSWTPDATISGYATYGLKLQLDSDTSIFQYSFPFQITAGSGGSVNSKTASSTSIVSSTTSSSSSSAVSSNEDTASITTTASTSSETTTGSNSDSTSPTGGGGGSQAATNPTSTGSSTASSTSAAVTAGADRPVAGGFAIVGGFVMAMLAL